MLWCVRCQRAVPARSAVYRYSLKLKVLVEDVLTWLTLYGKAVDSLLGMPAAQLHRLGKMYFADELVHSSNLMSELTVALCK